MCKHFQGNPCFQEAHQNFISIDKFTNTTKSKDILHQRMITKMLDSNAANATPKRTESRSLVLNKGRKRYSKVIVKGFLIMF